MTPKHAETLLFALKFEGTKPPWQYSGSPYHPGARIVSEKRTQLISYKKLHGHFGAPMVCAQQIMQIFWRCQAAIIFPTLPLCPWLLSPHLRDSLSSAVKLDTREINCLAPPAKCWTHHLARDEHVMKSFKSGAVNQGAVNQGGQRQALQTKATAFPSSISCTSIVLINVMGLKARARIPYEFLKYSLT